MSRTRIRATAQHHYRNRSCHSRPSKPPRPPGPARGIRVAVHAAEKAHNGMTGHSPAGSIALYLCGGIEMTDLSPPARFTLVGAIALALLPMLAPGGWGYSPLDQIDRENVGTLRAVWTRALTDGSQEGTPLAYGGVLYMPNPGDVTQAIDAATGNLVWECRRDNPGDVTEYVGNLTTNRIIAIYGRHIIDTSVDNHVFALDAETGRLAWKTPILDYTRHRARHSSGPTIVGGKVVSGRSCMPGGGSGMR